MADTVQEWQYVAGRCDRRDCSIEIVCKLDPYSAGLLHDEMDLGAGARLFRTKLNDDARPTRHSLVEGIETDLIDDGEGQMMQSDVGAPIERDRLAGRFDLPQR